MNIINEDKDFIQKLKKQDISAFEKLYERYAPELRYICMRYVRQYSEAEDIVQDGFITTFNKIHQYKGKGSFEGWLKRIFINKALEHLRKKKIIFDNIDDIHDEKLSNDEIFFKQNENNLNGAKHINEDNIDFEYIKEAGLTPDDILEAMDSLNDNYRIISNLFFIEKLKHKE